MIVSQSLPRPQRKGLITAELVLTLPIFFMMLMALFEFSLLFMARGELVEISRAGARLAALPGVSSADVRAEILRLTKRKWQQNMNVQVHQGQHSGDLITVVISIPTKDVTPDLLWPIGIGLKDQHLNAVTHMIRE